MIGTILVSLGVLAAAPETHQQPTTRIYVRTIPPGARIELDGRRLGASDGLFIVPPGVRKITVEMDGYDPEAKTVEVRDGWITRVEVRLNKRPGPGAGQQAPPDPFETITQPPDQRDQAPPNPFETRAAGDELSGFDAVIERVVNEDAEDRDVFIDLDTGELMTPPGKRRGDNKAIQAWIRSHGVDALGKMSPEVRGLVGFDMIIVPVVNRHWDSATRRLSAANPLLISGSPGFPVFLKAEEEPPQTYEFKTREGGFGVLQILGFAEDPKGVKIRYKLARPRQMVCLVEDGIVVGHVDDSAEGKRSLAGSGHAVLLHRPEGAKSVVAVQIYASRYGYPLAPEEDFHVYLLDQERKVIKELAYAYGLIERGEDRWYTLEMEPVEVPQRFYVALSFNPEQTKGIFVGIDEDAEEFHSYEGLPGRGFQPVTERYNWMIRARLAGEAEVGKK